jgi:hypothetical protein
MLCEARRGRQLASSLPGRRRWLGRRHRQWWDGNGGGGCDLHHGGDNRRANGATWHSHLAWMQRARQWLARGPGSDEAGRQVGPMRQLFFQITNPEFSFSHGKNRYNLNKKPKKISGGRKSNLEHFLLLQRLPNLHGF